MSKVPMQPKKTTSLFHLFTSLVLSLFSNWAFPSLSIRLPPVCLLSLVHVRNICREKLNGYMILSMLENWKQISRVDLGYKLKTVTSALSMRKHWASFFSTLSNSVVVVVVVVVVVAVAVLAVAVVVVIVVLGSSKIIIIIIIIYSSSSSSSSSNSNSG